MDFVDSAMKPSAKIHRSVQWIEQQSTLRMIDQRQLPHNLTTVDYTTVEDVASAISRMVVRGAPAIGIAASFGMVLASRHGVDLNHAKQLLDSSRPTAVNLASATKILLRVGEAGGNMLAAAQKLANHDANVNKRLVDIGQTVLPEGDAPVRIMHHCHTGSLATAGYGTALGVAIEAHRRGRKILVRVNETRPVLQGSRLTTFELMSEGVPCILNVDGAAAALLASGDVDVCLVGADRVARNGDVANKIGTLALAVIANHYNVPVYAVVPTSTIDLETNTGNDIVIEQRSEKEVTDVCGGRIAPKGVRVFNPAFDVAPASLFSGIITEHGICRAPFDKSIVQAKMKGEKERHQLLDVLYSSTQ